MDFSFLNSREQAITIWLLALAAFVLTKAEIRSSLGQVISALSSWKLLLNFAIYYAFVATIVLIARELNIWDGTLLKATIVWAAFSGTSLLVSMMTKREHHDFIESAAKNVFEISVLLAFFFNIKTFSLAWELALQPTLAVCVMCSVVAARSVDMQPAKRLFDVVLTLLVGFLLINTAIWLIRDHSSIQWQHYSKELALNFWLPLASIPFIYLCALISQYEVAFMRTRFAMRQAKPSFSNKVGMILGLRFDLRAVGSLHGPRAAQAGTAPSIRLAIQAVREHKRDLAKHREDELVAEARLIRFAGIDGANPDGTRLDQREFNETKDALRWLASCHMGWFRKGGRYVPNMMEILGDFARQGLSTDHGIVHEVSEDGQGWWAWRRTISGWVFAIGASGPPPNQWFYDGPEPPRGFPGRDPMWGNIPFEASGVNW